MNEMENSELSVPNLLKEINLLEEDVEMQAYINGLWVKHFSTIKEFVNKEYPGSRLSDLINSSIGESSSWEDEWEWLENAKRSEREYLEKTDLIKPGKSSDIQTIKAENNYLRGIIRALLSKRLTRLEQILIGYVDWNRDLINEIEELLNTSGLVPLDTDYPK